MTSSQLIFSFIITILLFDFLFESFLSFLNNKKRNSSLPKELKGIYDDASYHNQQDYEIAN